MKKIISLLLVTVLIVSAFLCVPFNVLAAEYKGTLIKDANMYDNAGTKGHAVEGETSAFVKTVESGSPVSLIGSKTDGDGDLWYNVKLTDGTQGYIYAPNIKKDTIRNYNSDFEKNLLLFPESYRASLRTLHNTYPNWKFIAEYTYCDFNEAVNAEYCPGTKNLPRKFVELTYNDESWRDPRAKNTNGTWKNAEGSGRWTYASKEAIAYFMNPANHLTDNSIFMFLNLSSSSLANARDMVKSAVKGTFLDKDQYVDAIIKSSESSGVSPVFIVATIIGEQGANSTSPLVTGSQGYYNLFNAGASGKTNDEIISSGLDYAKKMGWDTIEKAIVGGADFSSSNYVKSGQDTYYYMDYNIVKCEFNHQYAASLYDAYNKGYLLAKGCKTNKNATMEFIIPVFSGTMPASPKPQIKPTPTPTPTPVTVKKGDTNGDGKITIIDLANVQKHILGIITLSGNNLKGADTNGDNKITIVDLANVQKHLLGLIKLS